MKQVFDYAGNEIKEGDEFCCITVIKKHPRFGYCIAGAIDYFDEQKPDEECWEPQEYHKVIVREETMKELGYLIIEKWEEYTFSFYNTIETLQAMWITNCTILAIKRISDTKEYYKSWKKRKNFAPPNIQ